MKLNKQVVRVLAILTLFILAVPSVVNAYTVTVNDATDYDDADGWYSIWTFSYVSVNTNNGQMKLRGSNGWNAVHYAKLWMMMEFTASASGRVHMSAEMSLSFRLIAGTVIGGYSYLYINFLLCDSDQEALESDNVYESEADCVTTGIYDIEHGTPNIDTSVYWTYYLQISTTYYAVVEIYVPIYNGGYAYSDAGGVGNPTTLSLDVAEISVYT